MDFDRTNPLERSEIARTSIVSSRVMSINYISNKKENVLISIMANATALG